MKLIRGKAWLLLATLLLATALPGSASARQHTLQLAEDGVVTRRVTHDAVASTRMCEPEARWLRIGFAALSLHGNDSVMLTSSDGDHLRLGGPRWNGRSFHTRALRGDCVFLSTSFANDASRYELSDYQAGTRTLQETTAIVAGAADICDATPTECRKTSDLILGIDPVQVFVAGDNAYDSGTLDEYNTRYDPNWGRFKALTAPVPGNHEYFTAGAAGYFDYFNGPGNQTGPAGDRTQGYYSYDVGEWHFIALNSRSGGTVSSAQLAWLDADLRANTKLCTAAYMHHPLVSRGKYRGYASMKPIFDRLYAARADLLLTGHDHNYERYAPMDGGQVARSDGVREVIVGTGGGPLALITATHPLLQVSEDHTWGVLKLTLGASGYTADFVPIAGQTFTDSFSSTCRRAQGVVGDFLLTGSSSLTLPQGRTGAKNITVGSYGDFNAPVTLTVSGLPAGITGSFSPNPVTPPPDGTILSRLTLTASSSATLGTFVVTVKGTSGAIIRTFTFKLLVKAP